MTLPLMFTGAHKIQEGKMDAYQEAARRIVEAVRQQEPRMLVYGLYVDEARSTAYWVEILPDSAAVMNHFQVVGPMAGDVMQHIVSKDFVIHGEPSDEIVGLVRQLIGPQDSLHVVPNVVGFSRMELPASEPTA